MESLNKLLLTDSDISEVKAVLKPDSERFLVREIDKSLIIYFKKPVQSMIGVFLYLSTPEKILNPDDIQYSGMVALVYCYS
jgi:hypothetical protein